jgi:nicotinamidase-related amidase
VKYYRQLERPARGRSFISAIMKKKSPDLHGNAPDKARVALLLIDVINDLEFPGAGQFAKVALRAAGHIARLKQRSVAAGIPVIYANDNYGKWRSDFRNLVSHCIDDQTRGREIVELLRPQPEDYFVLKPKHSAFYSSSLEILLKHLGAETLILAGFTGDICILFTANDAYMRDYKLIVPSDCVVSLDEKENENALRYMKRVLEADIRNSGELDLNREQPQQVRAEPGVRQARSAYSL